MANKKGLLILVFAVCIAGSAFALPEFKFSIGAGGYITNDISGGTRGEIGDVKMAMSNDYHQTPIGGGFLFLDFTFAELSFGIFGGKGLFYNSYEDNSSLFISEIPTSLVGLDIGLMGKYPFAIGSIFYLYPLLGMDYRIIAIMNDGDGNKIADAVDHSDLWFRLGIGMDLFFIPALYLRLGFTGGLKLPNKFERDAVEYYKSLGMDAKAYPGFGFDLKLAIGYRFSRR